jgi:hypothetical protein
LKPDCKKVGEALDYLAGREKVQLLATRLLKGRNSFGLLLNLPFQRRFSSGLNSREENELLQTWLVQRRITS